MNSNSLDRNLFLVKEKVGLFKASSNYDVLDPSSGELILQCREPNLGIVTKLFRFTKYKRNTPFDVSIMDPSGDVHVRVRRGVSLFLSKVMVEDGEGRVLGGFRQKLFSIGGSFSVVDAEGRPQCELKGKWTGWDFRFVNGTQELAKVTKKWAGIGKEMFTSADNYVLEIDGDVPAGHPIRKLILGAVMTIDLVLKE
ncbi:MAG: phospholipid scramblase-related protein [Planctomycetota bacterium]|nr:phospholipid scramblase-related protein [Planctomycetota bacterium]MDA1180311.1 phospholipid scramblase-related protein [Planctomycetota bacterium]